ncbi:4a-hydroxytetrahydrobiopterin dehydratase [Nocardioides montaniterrae]
MDPKQLLTDEEIAAIAPEGWSVKGDALVATYATGSFVTGLRLVNALGEAAEAADHHPDLTLTYPTVSVLLTSHDAGGITLRDIDLARRTGALAAEQGIALAD